MANIIRLFLKLHLTTASEGIFSPNIKSGFDQSSDCDHRGSLRSTYFLYIYLLLFSQMAPNLTNKIDIFYRISHKTSQTIFIIELISLNHFYSPLNFLYILYIIFLTFSNYILVCRVGDFNSRINRNIIFCNAC